MADPTRPFPWLYCVSVGCDFSCVVLYFYESRAAAVVIVVVVDVVVVAVLCSLAQKPTFQSCFLKTSDLRACHSWLWWDGCILPSLCAFSWRLLCCLGPISNSQDMKQLPLGKLDVFLSFELLLQSTCAVESRLQPMLLSGGCRTGGMCSRGGVGGGVVTVCDEFAWSRRARWARVFLLLVRFVF